MVDLRCEESFLSFQRVRGNLIEKLKIIRDKVNTVMIFPLAGSENIYNLTKQGWPFRRDEKKFQHPESSEPLEFSTLNGCGV